MAGKKCPQCAEVVKPEALVCRFCGHKFPELPAKKPMGLGKKVLIAFGGLVLASTIINLTVAIGGKTGASVATPTASPSGKSRDDLAGMAILAGASLKKAARDPDSLEIERAYGRTEKHGVSYVCVLYRARNGFGGMNREHAVFSLAGGDPSAKAWNKWCDGSDGYSELTGSVTTGTSMSS